MSVRVNDRVTWVGKTDWELRRFHGDEYSTHRGSSYNSYLVRDEKTVLIDTVWRPHAKEYVEKLKQEIDLNEIDYIVIHHGEVDHSGALPELMKEIPDTPIYCTAQGVKTLTGQYHQEWNFVPYKTGDTLDLGSRKLIFIEGKMLHWPDSSFSYLTEDNIFFSNDAFGQHISSELMFNDLMDPCELMQEAIKYYANILTPFSKQVQNKLEEILALNLPIDMICPAHGVIWRDNPMQIVEKYSQWSSGYQEDQVTIFYDTMWENTRLMAHALKDGIVSADRGLTVKLYNVAKTDKNDLMTEIFKSRLVLAGSSTVNNGLLSGMGSILEEIEGLRFKNKKAMCFGSYGWSGESVKLLNERMEKAGFEVIHEGIRTIWTPDTAAMEEIRAVGRQLAEQL